MRKKRIEKRNHYTTKKFLNCPIFPPRSITTTTPRRKKNQQKILKNQSNYPLFEV